MESSRSSDVASQSLQGQDRKRAGQNSFLNKLRDILGNASVREVICWSGDGDRFDILSSQRLQDEVIPMYFKHKNMKSFVRQLNLHGFKKIRNGSRNSESNSTESYRHTLFRKHQPDLLHFIKRKVTKPVEADDKSEQINYLLEQKRKLEEKCSTVKEDRDNDYLKIISDCQKTETGRVLLSAMKIYLQYPEESCKTNSSDDYLHNLTKNFINNLISIGKTKGSDDIKSQTSAPTTAESDSLGKRADAARESDDNLDNLYQECILSNDYMSEENPFNLDYQDDDQCIASGEIKWHLISRTISK